MTCTSDYRVEIMTGERVDSHRVSNAETPSEAAEKATGRGVRGRTDEQTWVRVTDETRRAVFKYAFK